MLLAAASAAANGEEESHPSVSLADVVFALENVDLLPKDVGKPNTASVMLAHTELENRFNSDESRSW